MALVLAECSSAQGEAIRQMLSGQSARVKLGSAEGKFSLNGFKDAWAKTRELGKKKS